MSIFFQRYSVDDFLKEAKGHHLISKDKMEKAQEIAQKTVKEHASHFIHSLLMGVSAFITSLSLFIGIGSYDPNDRWWLSFLIVVGIALYYFYRGREKETKAFLMGFLSLVLVWLGKIALFDTFATHGPSIIALSGMSEILPRRFDNFIYLFIVTLLVYPFYKMVVDRFASALGTIVILILVFYDVLLNPSSFVQTPIFCAVCLILFGLASLLIVPIKKAQKDSLLPLAYAALSGLGMMAVLFDSASWLVGPKFQWTEVPLFFKALVTLSLLGVTYYFAKPFEQTHMRPISIGMVFICGLGMMMSPGILLALLVMGVGYGCHKRLLLVISVPFFCFSLFVYYYNLHLLLWEKGMLLMGSGAFLLLGRWWLKKMNGGTHAL